MSNGQLDIFTGEERSAAEEGLANARLALANARERADQAMASVAHNAGQEWNDEAYAFLREYLTAHPTMHVDELWRAGLPRPHDMRALGPIVLRATRNGLLVGTGRYLPSVHSNGSPKQVWRSLIYGAIETRGDVNDG